jgi:hypothetical protein
MALKSQAKPIALGGPGIGPRWTRGAKVAVGTAYLGAHDPTSFNRQRSDVGSQYGSAIFFQSLEQEATAHASKSGCDKAAGSRGRLLPR